MMSGTLAHAAVRWSGCPRTAAWRVTPDAAASTSLVLRGGGFPCAVRPDGNCRTHKARQALNAQERPAGAGGRQNAAEPNVDAWEAKTAGKKKAARGKRRPRPPHPRWFSYRHDRQGRMSSGRGGSSPTISPAGAILFTRAMLHPIHFGPSSSVQLPRALAYGRNACGGMRPASLARCGLERPSRPNWDGRKGRGIHGTAR
jgi:hypothetical protein